jgi:hypothetical protein
MNILTKNFRRYIPTTLRRLLQRTQEGKSYDDMIFLPTELPLE